MVSICIVGPEVHPDLQGHLRWDWMGSGQPGGRRAGVMTAASLPGTQKAV